MTSKPPKLNEDWTVVDLAAMVADTDRYAGGGVVSAMSLAGAAATAELVFQLASNRRSLSDEDRQILINSVALCQELRMEAIAAIDADIDSLTELMDSQAALRRAKKEGSVIPNEAAVRAENAIQAAIDSPLRLARSATKLLDALQETHHLARPFTASDLGAAAATTGGAITSLLLMAEVNLGMLSENDDSTLIAQEIEDLYSLAQERATAIVGRTRDVIR